MAWLDDRAWCHPKLVALSDRAHRTYINAISYSSGMGLGGVLGPNHQRLVGSTSSTRRELIEARLWDDLGDAISIHDWKSHNEKRDERRAKDRERKKSARLSARLSAGTSAGHSNGASAVAAHVEGSEGSEVRTTKPNTKQRDVA